MRSVTVFIVALVAAIAAHGVARADADADARAVIAKAIKASGGEEKVAKFQVRTWKESGTIGDGVAYTGYYAFEWPGRFIINIKNQLMIVINGDKGMVFQERSSHPREMFKDELEIAKEDRYPVWVATLLPLKDKSFTLTPVAEIKVGDKPAAGIRVSSKGHGDVNLYFDKETGLLVKSEYRIDKETGVLAKSEHRTKAAGKEVNQELFFQDYKDVSGAKMPGKIIIKRDGKRIIEAEITELKGGEKLEGFDKLP